MVLFGSFLRRVKSLEPSGNRKPTRLRRRVDGRGIPRPLRLLLAAPGPKESRRCPRQLARGRPGRLRMKSRRGKGPPGTMANDSFIAN